MKIGIDGFALSAREIRSTGWFPMGTSATVIPSKLLSPVQLCVGGGVVVRSMMRSVGLIVLAGVLGIAGTAAGQTPPAAPPNTGGLAVTVTYKGKGEVKPGNEIAIFLFDTPTINAESNPIGMQIVEKNSGVATFTNLPATVYIAVVFDEKGVYDQQGPPPTGTPTSIYSDKAGAAMAVSTGKAAKVSVTFDDTTRMP